jgi:hypothetical protein
LPGGKPEALQHTSYPNSNSSGYKTENLYGNKFVIAVFVTYSLLISAFSLISGPQGYCVIAVVQSPRSQSKQISNPEEASFCINGRNTRFLLQVTMEMRAYKCHNLKFRF